jgi:hypothetical protein
MVARLRRLAGAAAGALLLLLGLSSQERVEPKTPVRAAFADGKLWLLSEEGEVYSISDTARGATRAPVADGLDLCILGGAPTVVAGKRDKPPFWRIRRRAGSAWKEVARVASRGESFVAFACADTRAVVLTSHRLIEISGSRQREVRLSGQVVPAIVGTTAYMSADKLFVGFNVGEWGGGLVRIGRASGEVRHLERNVSGDLCGGPLNSGCDPVNGFAAEPWKADCVVAAIGLVHLAPHGRLIELCGDRVERIYFKPFELGWPDQDRRLDNGEPFSTVAFFGVASAGGSLWAIGIDGLYRVTGPGRAEFTPLPKFREVGGFQVSFDIPGIALALTGMNGRAAMSGTVPIMAVR